MLLLQACDASHEGELGETVNGQMRAVGIEGSYGVWSKWKVNRCWSVVNIRRLSAVYLCTMHHEIFDVAAVLALS